VKPVDPLQDEVEEPALPPRRATRRQRTEAPQFQDLRIHSDGGNIFFESRTPSIRAWVLVAALLTALVSVVGGVVLTSRAGSGEYLYFAIGATTAAGIVIRILDLHRNRDDRMISQLQLERAQLQQKISQEPRPDVLDTARLSLNDLEQYHRMNLIQGRRSFNMGVLAFFAGLGVIVAGITIYYARPAGGVQVAAISAVGGAIGSFISASCLSLYRGAMSQANYFYRNLAQAQDTMISIRLCDEIEDPNARAEAIRELIEALSSGRAAESGSADGSRRSRGRGRGRRPTSTDAPGEQASDRAAEPSR
jgi:hypothetical protein